MYILNISVGFCYNTHGTLFSAKQEQQPTLHGGRGRIQKKKPKKQ